MGRTRQNRKRRSSRPTVRQSSSRKKVLNPAGNNVVAKSWNKKETLAENYSRFGLVARLGTAAGGYTRKNAAASVCAAAVMAPPSAAPDSLGLRSASRGLVRVGEVRVERDADGRIVRVIRPDNPLNDPLLHLDSDEDEDDDEGDSGKKRRDGGGGARQTTAAAYDDGKGREKEEARKRRRLFGGGAGDGQDEKEEVVVVSGRVVDQLEREAGRPVEKYERRQSTHELEWLRRLADRHGDDTAAMARDLRLNPFQRTAADLTRRLRKAGLVV